MIDPWRMDPRDWFDAVIMDTRSGWVFGSFDGKDWQAFATGFVRAPPFVNRTLPDPYQFAKWEDWAMRTAPMLDNR